MGDLFFNNNGRLRSGWRFTFFIFAFIFLVAIFTKLANDLLHYLPIDFEENSLVAQVYEKAIGLFLAIFLGWFCGKLFENLPFRALGAWFTKFWLKDFVFGLILGIGTITMAVVIAMFGGGLQFQYNESAGISAIQTSLLISFIIFLFGAAFEEVLIRGYILQTLIRAEFIWLGIIFTSLIFSSLHLGNPNVKTFAVINTFLAGIWLGIAYLKTRTLWLAFGLHLAWNWVLGAFYGIEVSGLTNLAPAPLLKEIDSGPNWITGGDYGIEGGITCSIALIVSTIFIWYIPFLKSTDEMLELTSQENPLIKNTQEKV